jgi:hypothetical protein
MRNERPSNCPYYIEKFVSDYYTDPVKFTPDAIEFTKTTDYTVQFSVSIDKDGKAAVDTIWFHPKQDSDKCWFEYDCITQKLT